MKKRFKLHKEKGKILILKWEVEGKLFGPDWGCVAVFDDVDGNIDRARKIVRLMNESDRKQ